MTSRYRIALACSVACLVVSAPSAHAVELPGLPISDVRSAMLNSKQATQLGISKQRVQSFTTTTSNARAVDDIWICDLTADEEIDIPGTRSIVKSVTRSVGASPLDLAVHEFHVFGSSKAAKRAYDDIVSKAGSCSGTHTPAPDVDMSDMSESVRKTTSLTNGVKRAPDGDRFVWIASQTIQPDATSGFAENSYRTLRHVGNTIQVLYIENEGDGVAPLSKRVITVADRLTDELGDRFPG